MKAFVGHKSFIQAMPPGSGALTGNYGEWYK